MASKSNSKRRRFSRKNKRDWRKHSDIKDIEDFLEEQRVQERTGGLVADKADDALFVVDTKTSSEKEEPVQRDKYAFRNKKLRCFQNLEPNPHIAAVPKAEPRGEKRNRSANTPRQIERINGILPPKEIKKLKVASAQRQKRKAEMDEQDKSKGQLPEVYDIWSEGPRDDLPAKLKNADSHFMLYTKRSRKRVPSSYHIKASKIDAVEVEDPGASYNPSYDDHQKLLRKVLEDERSYLKDKKIVDNWSKGVKKWRANELQDNYLSEMSAGLFDEEQVEGTGKEADIVKQEEEEDVPPPPNPPTTAESRKTRQQRRKQAMVKAAERQRQGAKMARIRQNDVYRVKALKKEIKKEAEKTEKRRNLNLQKWKTADAGTKRLGRTKFEGVPVAFKLSDELVGSLRQLKPEGSILRDRYKQMQKRNLIEARTWKRGTKRKLKEYVKKGHEEFKE